VCLFVLRRTSNFSAICRLTIAGDRAANLDLSLVLVAFSSEGTFTCHRICIYIEATLFLGPVPIFFLLGWHRNSPLLILNISLDRMEFFINVVKGLS
jgi:hypothetical protein